MLLRRAISRKANKRSQLFLFLLALFLTLPASSWAQSIIPPWRDCGSQLLGAIYSRDVNKAEKLIDARKDINFRGCPEETTPVIEAIGEYLPELAKKLILAGADPNLATKAGTTPLIMAAFYCQNELVPLLLERGALVNAAARDGTTALMNAAQSCDDGKIIRQLLQAGASVNLRARDGDTALTVAAFYGNESAVRQLVAAGADLSANNGEGTALTLAGDRGVGRKKSHDRIYRFLLDTIRKKS